MAEGVDARRCVRRCRCHVCCFIASALDCNDRERRGFFIAEGAGTVAGVSGRGGRQGVGRLCVVDVGGYALIYMTTFCDCEQICRVWCA